MLLPFLCIMLMPLPAAHAAEGILQNDTPKALSSTPRASMSDAEPLLVGIYFNRVLQAEETIYHESEEYWMPFELFLKQTGLKEQERQGSVASYATNLGTLRFDTASLKEFEGTVCIAFTDLKTVFISTPVFDYSLFAVMLNIPWQPGARPKREREVPDIKAPAGTVSYVGLEARGSYDFESATNKSMLVESAGRGLGGVWNITGSGESNEAGDTFTPTRYTWTTFNRNLAFRIGTGYSGSYSLIGPSYMTGVQFGWNNHSIIRQLDAEQGYGSDSFLSFDSNQLRTLEGSGPPGGIAELRFDGEVVARQRLKLDGRFAFENVRMDSDLRKTEVYIYFRSINENPLKVIDFSQTVASRSLPAGEIMVRGGAGRTGNVLDGESGSSRNNEAFANVLYGISQRVTLETAIQENPATGTPDMLAGTVLSIANNWTTALYGAQSNRHSAADVRVEGGNRNWNASYWGSLQDAGYGSATAAKEQRHALRLSLRPMQELTLQAIGSYQVQADSLTLHYLLPAGTIAPLTWLSLSATPHDDKTYRYESWVRLGNNDRLRGIYDNAIVSLDYQHNLSRQLNMRLVNDYAFKSGDMVTNFGIDWYPGNSSSDIIATVLSYSGGSYGISGSWSRYLNTGLRFAMQYTFNMNNAANLATTDIESAYGSSTTSAKSISLSMSWDLGWSNRGFIPINRNAVTLTRGALAGSLDIANESSLSASDINDIQILLNGRRMQQRQLNGDFFVGGLPPGIYRVSVDQENLPIELVTEKNEVRVEIKNGAVTGMKIPVYAEYGAAGMVRGAGGESIGGAVVRVSDAEGTTIKKAVTNQFGYYRVDGLRAGTYQAVVESNGGIRIESPSKMQFSIIDDYVFNVNLTAADH
ncbi:hypothetical protein Plut_1105 [Pelodictyon luteolum DSM 273]|uniref:Carboxypeptidase regulatory-like domain-containing protein n=2 Tax=Pelodictyon luteolum TaxID=1100 RepID=Q3B3W4_CHLL3|nr:hypothetical protein Plut_1105 [Pelodictyon luteolum DSM 273]